MRSLIQYVCGIDQWSHHGLVNGVGSFVGKYASGETRDTLLDSTLVTALQDTVVDQQVLTLDGGKLRFKDIYITNRSDCSILPHQEVQLELHVLEEPSHHGRQVDHVRRVVAFKECSRRCHITG